MSAEPLVGEAAAITVAELKNRPAEFLMARLQQGHDAGLRRLTVRNRGRPILHLGLADDLPPPWRSLELATLPVSDLKRSQVSLTGLRRDRRAMLLSQRGGPTLALWPLEEADAAVADAMAADRAGHARGELAELRRRVRRLERRLDRLEDALAMVAKLELRLFTREGQVGKPREGEEGELEPSAADGEAT